MQTNVCHRALQFSSLFDIQFDFADELILRVFDLTGIIRFVKSEQNWNLGARKQGVPHKLEQKLSNRLTLGDISDINDKNLITRE